MMAKNNTRIKLVGFIVLATILLISLGTISLADEGDSNEPDDLWARACYGTYLVELPNTSAIWTLSRDGTFQGTDAAETTLSFDHQQGSWERRGKMAKGTWLNFRIDPDSSEMKEFGRVDAEFTFSDQCEAISGTFDLRFYALTGDPLETNAGNLIVDGDPFTGRRINP